MDLGAFSVSLAVKDIEAARDVIAGCGVLLVQLSNVAFAVGQIVPWAEAGVGAVATVASGAGGVR